MIGRCAAVVALTFVVAGPALPRAWSQAPGAGKAVAEFVQSHGGKVSYGMNLDGKVGPRDFTSPDGETGIDNQLYRAIGCVDGWRAPVGVLDQFGLTRMFKSSEYNRVLVEITGIDSLTNSDSVEVTTYRGMDPLLTDATGTTIMPGGSQRIETKYSAKLVSHRHEVSAVALGHRRAGRVVEGRDDVDEPERRGARGQADDLQARAGGVDRDR